MLDEELLDDLCVVIARRTPFPKDEIKTAYKICKSLDMVLFAVEYSSRMGMALPLDNLVKMTSTREAYQEYMEHRFRLQNDS